jgi:hypothetical protein
MNKLREYDRYYMQKSIGFFFIFVFIAVILAAGCTNKESTNTTPQIVYVTVLVTPTPTVVPIVSGTPEITKPTMSHETKTDEAFIDYINKNQIMEGMTALMKVSAGAYSIRTGYNANAKTEAARLTDLLIEGPLPGSGKVKTLRSAMMDALAEMDGSTAGFSRYQDAMETVIMARNTALSEMHSVGSSIVDATYVSGHGNGIRLFNATETGPKIFTMRHTGDHNFAITLKDGTGKYLSLLVNEIGDYSGEKSERLTAGNYSLDITSDGDWTIGIIEG